MDFDEIASDYRMGRKVCAVDPVSFIGNVMRNR
jgi:hypothetical protein